MGIISGLLSMLGWGTADFLGAVASRKTGHFLTILWMQIFGFGLAFIYFLFNFSSFNLNDIQKFIFVLIINGFLQAIAFLAFYKGFEEGLVSVVSPIGASWALITVILSAVFFKEILALNHILAIFLIIAGIFLISTNLKELSKTKRVAFLKGAKYGMVAMFSWGVAMFLIVPTSKALGWFMPVLILRFFTVLFLFIFLFFSKNYKQSLQTFRISLFPVLFLIGFFDAAGFFAYSSGVEGEYTSIVASIGGSFSLVTVILARIFLKEKIAANQVLGIASVITGIVLISI